MINQTQDNADKKEARLGLLNLLVLILSIYVFGAMAISTFCKLPEEILKILDLLDNGICVVFFLDFCVRLYRSDNKLKFMRWGWIDLISSIPAVDCLRVGRVFRLIRLFRIIRAFRSIKSLLDDLFHSKTKGAFGTGFIIAILLVMFSSIAILQVEDDPESNIVTAEDAIWWSYVTITTIGYGDLYPVTTEGRIIAAILMTGGLGLFGTFTGFVASWFSMGKKKEENEES